MLSHVAGGKPNLIGLYRHCESASFFEADSVII